MEMYDNTITDVQATPVEPVSPESFDFGAFQSHESELLTRCEKFMQQDSGVAVHRRVRPGNVFLDACRDKKESLDLQLGALQKSMQYQADIPNFLEPWYGIGIGASAFGADYIWNEGQAPATKPLFNDIKEALSYSVVPISKTPIGRYVLETIDYFMDKTKGMLPMSLSDVQSPFNTAIALVGADTLLTQAIDDPHSLRELLIRIASLNKEFIREQMKHFDSNIVFPGHGFASSRCFLGLGMSDDNAIMLSPALYEDITIPSMCDMADPLSGPVFHSCGNWEHLAPSIRAIPNLKMVDCAVGSYTDPMPNTPENISDVFKNTDIIVNARIVGDPEMVLKYVKRLWNDGMKLIAVTYCDTPEQQQQAYRQIHAIAEKQSMKVRPTRKIKAITAQRDVGQVAQTEQKQEVYAGDNE